MSDTRDATPESREQIMKLVDHVLDNGCYLPSEAAYRIALFVRSESGTTTELEQAYQVLESYGVPRGRAKSVPNGIGVLATRIGRDEHFQQAMAADAACFRFLVADPETARHLLSLLQQGKGDVDSLRRMIDRITASKEAANAAR